jgi:hypothetical protein
MKAKKAAGVPARDSAQIKQEIMKLEKEIKAAKALADPKAAVSFHEDIFADDLIDIHASGWIYTREQSIALEKNMAATPRQVKILRSASSEQHIRFLAENVVAVTELTETYFEVPNPMQESLAAGTFTMSPKATAASRAPAFGPGEDFSPNPYRTRITRIWVRKGKRWKLAISQATRLGKRVRTGLV